MRYLIMMTLATIWTATTAMAELSEPAQELCGRLETMLLETQLQMDNANRTVLETREAQLKKAYTTYCMEERPFGAWPSYENGQAMHAGGQWYFPDGSAYEEARDLDYFLRKAAILAPFLAKHNSCASGCSYVSWGIWGDEAHQRRKSCHNSGEAIDIHAIRCRGKTHSGQSARFNSYVGCMRGKFHVIYGSGDHENHAHIQLRNCRKI